MPSRYSADMSAEDAESEARRVGILFRSISIEPTFNAFMQSLEGEFSGYGVDVTEENIQARCRGVILMAIANKKRLMVLTTGNKSELAVGYSTLYGDMAGGFAPLKDLSKQMVYRLAEWRNSDALAKGEDLVIPQRVIERPPPAELAPDQQDSDSLPEYEVLDQILELYVEQDSCVTDIVAAGFEQELVERITRMVDRNEHKRRQAPPGVRITPRAFGRDRRYPITSGFQSR
jgi:NAD+ synthase (glutamine-hydrolysing)